jgi:hypothetical protein
MAENRLEDLDPIFSDKQRSVSSDALEAIDPIFRDQPRSVPAAKADEQEETISFSPRDAAVVGGVAGAVPAVRGARTLNAIRAAEAKARTDMLAKQAAEAVQMRPGAQPAGATAAQIMEPGQMTAGDKWASKIGGPGGGVAGQAYENFRTAKTLRPGETLMRSGLVVVPDVRTNLGELQAEAVRRENPPPRPPSMGSQAMGALGAASRFLGPNRIIGPLAGAFAGHQAATGAEQTGIDAALSGLSATGGAMMASGVPAFQIPGAALAAAPYAGRAMAPAGADLLERLFPLKTGMERQPTRQELLEAMSRQMLRGRVQ